MTIAAEQIATTSSIDAAAAPNRSPVQQLRYELSQAVLQLETYENAIRDCGGLDRLCYVMTHSLLVPGATPRPPSVLQPPALAAWVAWVEAGGADVGGVPLPWLEERTAA